MGALGAWDWVILLGICGWVFSSLVDISKEVRKNRIIMWAVALFIASIIYSPHRIYYVEESPVSGWNQPTVVTKTQIDRVEYALIWEAPERSSLEFGRLALTWMGIAVIGVAALYVNHNQAQPQPPPAT